MIFLATLGVYFGLVLIGGASPQVYAQAATTRNFELKDEVEVKDDLDTNPDDCEKLAAKAKEKQRRFPIEENTFFSYSKAIADVTSTVQQLSSTQFYFNSSAYGDSSLPHYVSIEFEGKPILFPGKTRRKLENEILVLSHIFPTAVLGTQKRFEFSLALDKSDLVTTAKFLRHDDVEAHQAFIAYDSILDLWRCTAKHSTDVLLSKNTEISWIKNQVLVVTRLPRAGLDSLLAKDAK